MSFKIIKLDFKSPNPLINKSDKKKLGNVVKFNRMKVQGQKLKVKPPVTLPPSPSTFASIIKGKQS